VRLRGTRERNEHVPLIGLPASWASYERVVKLVRVPFQEFLQLLAPDLPVPDAPLLLGYWEGYTPEPT
jgi:hypothetical protein